MSVRVASVPTNHVYVRHLDPVGGPDGVRRLPDPPPVREVTGAPWWPPRVLDPSWLLAHAADYDVVHVHFGFDAESPEALRTWTRTLRALGKPLVVTVHDLRNPHHEEPSLHEAQLRVLLDAAAAVVTLTPGAAAELADRFGVHARVLPHPHVVDLEAVARPRPVHEGFVVGVHCKSLRAGMDPLPVVETLAGVVPEHPDGRLRVDAHTDVMTPGSARYAPDLAVRLRALAADGRLELVVHDYFTDAELFAYLAGLDVSVLPYRFGTHSGWLEACHDLGTTVLAPDCGYYAQQRPLIGYRAGDPASLVAAVERAFEDRPTWRATVAGRRAERILLADAHADVYRGVLAPGEVACTS